MIYGLLAILVAWACVALVSLAFKSKRRLFRFALAGLVAGYSVGFAAGFVLGFLHYELPPLELGGPYYTSSVWIAPVFGVGGMLVGAVRAVRWRPDAA